MTLHISEEFKLDKFEAWGGATSRLDEIIELGITGEAQIYMEEILDYNGQVVSATDINDLLWFGMDDFIQYFKELYEEED